MTHAVAAAQPWDWLDWVAGTPNATLASASSRTGDTSACAVPRALVAAGVQCFDAPPRRRANRMTTPPRSADSTMTRKRGALAVVSQKWIVTVWPSVTRILRRPEFAYRTRTLRMLLNGLRV